MTLPYIDNEKDPRRRKPTFKLPKGFENEAAFLSAMRKDFYNDIQFDRLNRESALEDLKFTVGDQWNDLVRQKREAARKPVLTVNRIPAFIAQIIGSRRQSETVIKIAPDNGGTQDVATLREGLIRSIQKTSRADIAYDKALEGAVCCGIGNFQVELNFSPDDIWVQEIGVGSINDHLSVVWDRMMQDGTGRDAKHCFVVDSLAKEDFTTRWPWASPSDVMVDTTLRGDLRMNGWIAIDDVRIVNYWRMCSEPRILALMQDGTTKDITEEYDDAETLPVDTLSKIQQNPTDGTPMMREVQKPYAEMYLCSGLDILDGPYRLECSRLPVFRVPGWEISVGEWKHRWGLVRFLKDPQRLHNFWRSIVAEKLMQSPRAVWLAAQSAVAGREKEWRNSHLSDDPLLIWNDDSGSKPERAAPAQMENALMAQAEMTTQDIKDVSNIHEANLGMPSNEVSGAAIMARQRVSDTGTILYHDNLNLAMEEAGRVMDELISYTYDTARVVKIMGQDGKDVLTAINQKNPNGDGLLNDITAGKYSVTVTTGPNTATKRIEAGENMQNVINAFPQFAAITADLIVDAQDWPGKDKFVARLRRALPPGMLDPADMSPAEQAAAQQQQQQGAKQGAISDAAAAAKIGADQSTAALNNARARNFEVEADLAPSKAQNDSIDTASQAAHRELTGSLAAIKVADGK